MSGLDYQQEAALIDLCENPGLFAGQYPNLEALPPRFVERRYQGAGGLMGLAKAYPTDSALDWYREQGL